RPRPSAGGALRARPRRRPAPRSARGAPCRAATRPPTLLVPAAPRYHLTVMRTMNPIHDSTCSVAACAEILGAKWTAVLVHDLSEGPRRFGELDHSCSAISPRPLAERLGGVEGEEIVVRRSSAESPPRVEYELTEKGEALLPIIDEMRRFGHAWLGCGHTALTV